MPNLSGQYLLVTTSDMEKIPSLETLASKAINYPALATHTKYSAELKADLVKNHLNEIPEFELLFEYSVPEDYLQILNSEKFVAWFMNRLEKGKFDFLQFYLQKGYDISPIIYHALLCGYYSELQSKKVFLSPFLMEYLTLFQTIVPPAAREIHHQKRIDIHSILSEEKKLTENAMKFLLPYLKRMFPSIPHDEKVLESFVQTLPLEQRSFGLVGINYFLRLGLTRRDLGPDSGSFFWSSALADSISLILISESPIDPELRSNLQLFESLIRSDKWQIEQITQLEKIVSKQIDKLLDEHYSGVNGTTKDLRKKSLFLSFSRDFIYWNENDDSLPLVSILFASQYADFVYKHFSIPGHDKSVTAFLVCGIIPPRVIEETAARGGRPISIFHLTFKNPLQVHRNSVDLWANRLHDYSHLSDVVSVAHPIRMGLMILAHLIFRCTGKRNTITHFLGDMDFGNSSNLSRNGADDILMGLLGFYPSLYLRTSTKNLDRKQILEYHLIIIFGIISNPDTYFKSFFSHLPEIDCRVYMEEFLSSSLKRILPTIGDAEYAEIKANFKRDISIPKNIFCYLLNEAVKNKRLNKEKKEELISLAVQLENTFEWTRNEGLQIVSGSGNYIFVRDITNDNCDAVITTLQSLAVEQGKVRILKKSLSLISLISHQEKHPTVPFFESIQKILLSKNEKIEKIINIINRPGSPGLFATSQRHSALSFESEIKNYKIINHLHP